LTKSEDNLPQYYDISKLISDYNLSDYHGKDVVGLFNQALSIFNKASTHNEFLNAIGSFSQIISINRRYIPAYLYRAYASTRIGGFEAAIKDFTVAIELNPELYPVYIDRGNAYLELERFKEAIKDFTWVIDHDSTNKTVKNLREKAYARKNKFTK
jgi:tetratricopeptide (TPR) repeat protein